MRVMVVGGAGFIGSHLVDGLLAAGHIVSVVDNFFLGKEENIPKEALNYKIDASDFYSLLHSIIEERPEIIFNLAVLPLPHSLEKPFHNVGLNIKIICNLCELLRIGCYNRLIHFSSSEVYGSAQYASMGEDHPIEPSTPYAASKAAGDFICMSYSKTFNCDISVIRPFNNYGSRQNDQSYAGVIPLTINRILDGKSPIIYGDGNQTRDYIFVEDTIRAALLMMEKKNLKGEVFNIASGHDISIGWLIKTIQAILAKKGLDVKPILHERERSGDIRRHIANTFKAKDVLGFEHQIGMLDGLEKTIDWYIKKRMN
ncbi:MAG: GDP-mannose 4,6-dehydratase [Candidatus Omnitrophica bacterium]|jgi:UDP-glucose 4-epimerase|nr:GDP-mannose 4,6-dehydratase [Candidatus Omnitrophota bacterium]